MNATHLALPAALAAIAIPTATATAQSAAPPIPLELRARFGFAGPLVAKVGDGFGNLQVADLSGDGRLEAIAFDGRRARLVAVRVQDGATAMDEIPTGGQIAGYTVADVDGDRKNDLVLVDNRGRLTVGRPDAADAKRPIDLGLGGRGVGLFAGDLDGDGAQDLVCVAQGKLRIVTALATAPRLSAIEPIEDNVYSVHVTELDGDGRLDLVCVAPGDRMNLRMRLGRGDGTFGPWRIATVDGLGDVFPTTLPDGTSALATIEGKNRRVAVHRVDPAGDEAALEWWAFGESEGTRTPPFAIGDVDHDGDDDLVLFPPERAQMLVYEWRDGTFVRRTLPTLAGVAAVAIGDVDKDGKDDLVLASPEEDTLAWCPATAPLDQFPLQLPAVDKPIAVAVAPDGGVLVLGRDDKRKAHLHRVRPGAAPEQLADLGRLPADPARLLAADVGDRDGIEVAFVVPGEGLRTLTIGQDGKSAEKTTAGFTRKMDDGALALCEHDGKPALVAVRDRFVRCFRIDEQDQVRVLTQDNGPEGAAELTLACRLANGDWLYLDKKNDKLFRTQQGRPPRTLEVPAMGFTHMVPHRESALLLGPRGVLRVPFATGPCLRLCATHDAPTDRTFYWHGESGDFDHDGTADLLIVDRQLPGLQVLAGGPDGLSRALAVPVFETPPSDRPDNEPRELATGDLDGDGRCDFVLVAHDRILIYPQDR